MVRCKRPLFVVLALGAAASGSGLDEAAVQALYKAKCQACHLADGNAPIKEMNFTDSEWQHGGKLAEIKKVIEDGVAGKPMLPFKSQLSPEEIDALARYVRAFDKKLKPDPPPKGDR